MLRKTYEKIDSIGRAIMSIRATGVHNKELAEIIYPTGERSLAQVIALNGDEVTLQLFSGGFGLSTDCKVRFLGKPMQVGFSENMLGRVYSGNGSPIDNGPELMADQIRIAGPSINPVKRLIPKNMIRTGVPMIDVFNTLVQSQKIPIFAKAGEPYNRLLANIATQTDADVIIIGGVGLKYDEYHYFRDRVEDAGSKEKTIMFIHTHRDPIVEGLMVPDLALAVGELCPAGKKSICAAVGYDPVVGLPAASGQCPGPDPCQPGISRRPVFAAGQSLRKSRRHRGGRQSYHTRGNHHGRRHPPRT